MNLEKIVALNLRIYMAINNMSITDLSGLTGLSRTTITSIKDEKSKSITFVTLEKLSNALGISAYQLFEEKKIIQ